MRTRVHSGYLYKVWIHNDGSQSLFMPSFMLVSQNERFGLKIVVSRSANNLRNASYNSMSKLKTK